MDKGLPTSKSSLGSKATLRTGASWPRSVFCWLLSDTSTTLTMKSLRKAEKLRMNTCRATCADNLCPRVTKRTHRLWTNTSANCKINEKEKHNNSDFRQRPPECRCHIHPNSLRYLIFFIINITREITRMKIAASISHHALCFYCRDKPVQSKSILVANRRLSPSRLIINQSKVLLCLWGGNIIQVHCCVQLILHWNSNQITVWFSNTLHETEHNTHVAHKGFSSRHERSQSRVNVHGLTK